MKDSTATTTTRIPLGFQEIKNLAIIQSEGIDLARVEAKMREGVQHPNGLTYRLVGREAHRAQDSGGDWGMKHSDARRKPGRQPKRRDIYLLVISLGEEDAQATLYVERLATAKT